MGSYRLSPIEPAWNCIRFRDGFHMFGRIHCDLESLHCPLAQSSQRFHFSINSTGFPFFSILQKLLMLTEVSRRDGNQIENLAVGLLKPDCKLLNVRTRYSLLADSRFHARASPFWTAPGNHFWGCAQFIERKCVIFVSAYPLPFLFQMRDN